jgi:hypothetical protein
MLREPHPLASQAIDMRRANLRLPVATQIAVAQVIGDDEHHIRPRLGGAGGPSAKDRRKNYRKREYTIHRLTAI